MAIDHTVQPYISTFIQSQFPKLYETYGQTFIDFVTAYYNWMETEGPLYDSRRASSYQDIDTTVDKFIIFFKDKYLPNIQLETVSNIPQLIKHSLDVYRSRGTIRSIDLLFRLVFGIGAQVYYPFDDVFQPSSGEWIIPQYLEVSYQDDLNKFVGKEIVGVTSGAEAFVESWVRKKSGSKQIDCLYISALQGSFVTGERINAINSPFNLLTCPTMIGSLTEVVITDGGLGFNIGDVLPIASKNGYGGLGRVANVSQSTGVVNFTLNSGGYGYTANSQVLVSENVLSLTNVVPGANVVGNNYFSLFEVISQPTANINYQAANNGHFANNDNIFTYATNGAVLGTGIVLSQTTGVSTNGQIQVAVLSGNLQANMIFNTGNAIFASVPVSNGYISTTATGNVIAESLYFTSNVTNITGSFVPGETITQGNNSATLISITQQGATATLSANGRFGIWQPNVAFAGLTSTAAATIAQSFNMDVGIISTNGTFLGDSRCIITTSASGTKGVMPILNQGTGASFDISPTLLFPETVLINTDTLTSVLSKALSGTYGFAAFPSANLSTLIATALTDVAYTFGAIGGLVGTTPGTNYTVTPMARVYEPIAFVQQKLDTLVLSIANATSTFSNNDLVIQATSNARGLIISSNNSALVVNKMSLFNTFTANLVITAQSTGTTATVTATTPWTYLSPENIAEVYLGFDADISAKTLSANGSITSLQVLDSGWGFEDGELLTIQSANGSFDATGQAKLMNQGTGQGFYRTEDGFLSDIKKIQDSDYYQVSAYEVRASVAFEHYVDMLKSLLHVAGTKPFGAFYFHSTANAAVNILPATITQK